MSEERALYEIEPRDIMADTPLTDPTEVGRRRKVAVSAEKDREATMAGLMSIPNGRRWMWWLLGMCHVGHQPAHIVPNKGTVDVPRSFLNFGEMNVGLQLIAELHKACPAEYLKMITEAAEKEKPNAS
jgi:hypothetical protein